jgi:hypothetical protein
MGGFDSSGALGRGSAAATATARVLSPHQIESALDKLFEGGALGRGVRVRQAGHGPVAPQRAFASADAASAGHLLKSRGGEHVWLHLLTHTGRPRPFLSPSRTWSIRLCRPPRAPSLHAPSPAPPASPTPPLPTPPSPLPRPSELVLKAGPAYHVDPSPEITSGLYPHQAAALAWMIKRENEGHLPPFW